MLLSACGPLSLSFPASSIRAGTTMEKKPTSSSRKMPKTMPDGAHAPQAAPLQPVGQGVQQQRQHQADDEGGGDGERGVGDVPDGEGEQSENGGAERREEAGAEPFARRGMAG